MIIRKLSTLLVSFSLAWVPVSVTYAQAIPLAVPSEGSGSFGLSGPIYNGPSSLNNFGPRVDSTSQTSPLFLGPVSNPSPALSLEGTTSNWDYGLGLLGNWRNWGSPSTSQTSDHTSGSCLYCAWNKQQNATWPSLALPFGTLEPVSKRIATSGEKSCLDQYRDTIGPYAAEPFDICTCLMNSGEQAKLSESDIKAYEDYYNRDAKKEIIDNFTRRQDGIVEEFNNLRSSIYYATEFDTLTKALKKNIDPNAYESSQDCSSDFETFLSSVQESSANKCTSAGVAALSNEIEKSSLNLLVDNKTGQTISQSPGVEQVKLPADMLEVWNSMKDDMKQSSISNSEIASQLNIIKTLGIPAEYLKQAYSSAKDPKFAENNPQVKMESTKDIITYAFNLYLQKSQNEFIDNNSNPGAKSAAVNSEDMGFPTAVQVQVLAGGQEAAHLGTPIDIPFAQIHEAPAHANPDSSSDGGDQDVPRRASSPYGIVTAELGRSFARAMRDRSTDNKFMENLITKAPHFQLMFNDRSQIADMRTSLALIPGLESVKDLQTAKPEERQQKTADYLSKIKQVVCDDAKAKDPAKMLNIQYCQDDKANRSKYLLRLTHLASQNMGQRCAAMKDKFAHFCSAYSNKQPIATVNDGKSFLYSNFDFLDKSIFTPKPKDKNEHSLKVAQLSCYFSKRADAVKRTALGADDLKCSDVASSFLDSRAQSHVANSEIFGRGCKDEGNKNLTEAYKVTGEGSKVVTNNFNNVTNKDLSNDVAAAIVNTRNAEAGTSIVNKKYKNSSSSGEDEFANASKVKNFDASKVDPSDGNALPGTKETEHVSEIKPLIPSTFDSGSTLSPTVKSDKKLEPEEMQAIDPVKANQISASDQAIRDLQRRLDDSEKQLKQKQVAGDQEGAAQLSELIAQMREQREQMKNENEKLRKEMLEMMAAKERNQQSDAGNPSRSIASTPSFAPTPTGPINQKSSGPVSNGSGGGGGSLLPSGSSQLGGGSINSPRIDDYGISGRANVNQAPTLRLTAGELATAKFVNANSNQDIFSAILSAPKEPVYVREDGVIVKYVAQLDEDGNPVLDKDGKPILTSYRFQDPEKDDKKVAVRKPAAIAKPVIVKERKFTKKWSEVESVIQETVEPK